MNTTINPTRVSKVQSDAVDGGIATNWQPMQAFKRTLAKCTDTLASVTGQELPAAKKARVSVVRPKFNVKYADHLVHIGNARYLLYGESDGVVVLRIQECEYVPASGGEKHQAKMVRLTVQQWMDLMSEVDLINGAIEEFDDVKIPIGCNTFVRVQSQRRRVDIREFFLPEGACRDMQIAPDQFENIVVPTRRGISLTYEEWHNLVGHAAALITAGSEKLKTARKGSCLSHHGGERGWLTCCHCNCNGFSMW